MDIYKNIEAFYEENKDLLINGEYRPVVSYNKDAEEYINKLVQTYQKNGNPKSITVEEIEKGLKVNNGSNVATVESPLTWASLGLIQDVDDGLTKKDPKHKYKFTDEFIVLAEASIEPGVHILNRLLAIDSTSTISKFTNLLLCTLREGYIEGFIIDFPRDNTEYVKAITDEKVRHQYSSRVNKIYGYPIDDEASPHASMRAINNLAKLELIRQCGKTTEGFYKYEITEYGHRLLSAINYNLAGSKFNIAKIVDEPTDNSNYYSFLTALRAKPFMLLAGISGTGKSRIVRKLAQASVTEELQKLYDPKSVANGFKRWELHKPANFELIQVKPNWHNSMEVVGYKSNIGNPHYEFTPFVEFVARAWKHLDTPFFLCLDEMNLAPVEQYFAEFLSAIESRSIENDQYETDPIVKPFESFNSKKEDGTCIDISAQMISHLIGEIDTPEKSGLAERMRTKGLTLPKNLLVLGTVNMDDTTFSFSRKVLDRAMSVVMNEVEYEDFFRGLTENDVKEMSERIKTLLIERQIYGLKLEDSFKLDNTEVDEIKRYLTGINEKLNDTPFKLGYRTANEAMLYVSSAHAFNPTHSLNEIIDDFTLMKILSRIEGDKRSLEDLLENLKEVITEAYPKSNKKLCQMAKTLGKQQFVSYWT